MITSIDLNIDSKCTASCSHCCFMCSPKSCELLSDAEIDNVLDYIKRSKTLRHVSITGGEALLRYETVKKIIKSSSSARKYVSLVSNGFWGESLDNSLRIASELKECGLNALTLSFDSFHEEYISANRIRNVLLAVKQNNIRAAINIVVDKKHQSLQLVENLGEAVFGVNIAIMPVCRAGNSWKIPVQNLYFQNMKYDKMRCPAEPWEFAIHHDGFVYPCCSPTVFESALRIGNIRRQSLDEIEHSLNTNGLLYILKAEGLKWFIDRLQINIEGKKFVNVCEICRYIFSDQKNIKLLTPYIIDYYENIHL